MSDDRIHSLVEPGAEESRGLEAEARDRRGATLETALGREVRRLRKKHGMTVSELASVAALSAGMLSKIENGVTSPSLGTLRSLASALNVSMTAFFRPFEERRDASYVPAGGGLKIHRRGTRAGHEYALLGHSAGRSLTVEPYVITLDGNAEMRSTFQHGGVEFIYVLEGRLDYHHGGETYRLGPGDSLFFDAEASHGPGRLIETPIRMVCVIASADEDSVQP